MSNKRRIRGRKIPRVLYHWSPRSRRASILRRGLRIGRQCTAGKGMGQWRPPYLCFSDSPARALALCLNFAGRVLDLYEVWPMNSWTVHRRDDAREWRVSNHIGKSRFKYIASRRA